MTHTSVHTPHLTPRQLQILRQIEAFQARQCYSATIGELAGDLGISRPTAFEHIGALRKKGLVTKSSGKARCLKLTPSGIQLLEQLTEQQAQYARPEGALPLVGRVAAGAPIEAIEHIEPISLTELFGQGDDTFVLEVAGDSMIDEGICDGDYVVVKKTANAHNGDMVVAIVDDDTATVKRFFREKDHIRLEPANPAYNPILTDHCRIEGIVLGLLRRL